MRASAIAVPLLLFTAFLLVAAGHPIVAVAPTVGAIVLLLAFPYLMTDGIQQQPQANDSDIGVLRWVRRAAKYTIMMWFFLQPEVESFLKRITDGNAFWDWRLIVPVAVLTIYYIIWGWCRVAHISDRAIYTHFTKADSGSLSTSTLT